MSSLYCQIRKEWVAALPEEIVRQRILNHMVSELQFPQALVSVECALSRFPHLSPAERARAPSRRVDIVCFAKQASSGQLFPLLVVECKAVKLTPKVINQVLGYNHFMRARFIAIANASEFRTGWFDVQQQKFVFIDFLPDYHALMGS